MPRRHLRFVIAFCWGVAAAGLLALAFVVREEGIGGIRGAEFAVLLPGVVLGELVPLKLPLRGGEEEANLSTPFSFALLMSAGLAPALIAQAVASVLQDAIARKPAWRTAFNVGQYVISLAAAYTVLQSFGSDSGVDAHPTTPRALAAVLLAGCAFYVVNFVIVGTAVARYQGTPLHRYIRNDFKTTMLMAGVSVSLAPLVLAAVAQSPLLLILFVLPFLAVHRSGQLACDSARLAMQDALTGLPNRGRFQQLVDGVIADEDRVDGFAVLLLDLNRFKDINDTLGHHYGDLFLEETAARLRAAVREEDVVARLGGDEFAVLAHADDPEAVAERLSTALRPALELDGFLLEVDASIGTARYPADGTDLETLLRRADMAMYKAKQRHAGYVAYSPAIDDYDPERLALVADLRRALDDEQLVVHYQPQLDLRRGAVAGVEALVRWQHPRLGLLQPSAFVEMAEHTGLVRPLTHYVLRRALRQCAAWREEGHDLRVAVNVSPRSLLDRDLIEVIASALEETQLRADQLKLEITETAIMIEPAAALHVLSQLSAMGIGLSIDDFGTGYSSLAYLRRLPVGEVKIDRSFVLNMAREHGDRAIVRSTIDLAVNLGLAVVAEGVEDGDTLSELARLGCDEAQGYFISPPVRAADLSAWLSARTTPWELAPAASRHPVVQTA